MPPQLAVPLMLVVLAAYCLLELKEKTRKHMVSLGSAALSTGIGLLLAIASDDRYGALGRFFKQGSGRINLIAVIVTAILALVACFCTAKAGPPANGRWDRALRVSSFLAALLGCLMAFGAMIVMSR